ncbi:MAG: hypothetical protein ABIC57_03890, partial [bacterium]
MVSVINIPSIKSDFGIQFVKQNDKEVIFYLSRNKTKKVLSNTGISVSIADIQKFQELLKESIKTGKRNYWKISGKLHLEIGIWPVPLYDESWFKERMEKFEKWPSLVKQQKIQMKKNAKIIKAQGGYLPSHEIMLHIQIGDKEVNPEPIMLFFISKNLQKINSICYTPAV